MRLIKKVLAMSMVTALTFTGIEIPVNATEYTNTQSEAVTEVQTEVGNEEAVIINESADTLTDTSQAETVQSTNTSEEETTGDEPAAPNQIAIALPTKDSTATDNTTIEDKITAEDNSTSDKVAEEISDTQKMINAALLEKGTITLSEDLSIDEMLELKLQDTLEKAEITIMMNGHKITSEKAQAIMHVAENVTLTIKGEGSMINSAKNGIVVYNEGIVNLDNADLLATGSKSVGVLNNNTLGEKGLVIKSGTIKAEWFAIGKTVKEEASLNRPTVFFAAAGIVAASTSTEKNTAEINEANFEKGSYSVVEDATVVNESDDSIEVSNEKSTKEEITITEDTAVQPEVPSIPTTLDADLTTIPANQVTAVAPEIPVNVTAIVNSYNNIKIVWSSVADAQGYIIERMQSGTESTYTELAMITAAEYTDTAIAVGKEYKYRVYTYLYNESSELLKSNASSEVTALSSLAEPQSLTGVQASKTSIKLTWNAVEGAVKYKIYRAIKGRAYKLIKTQQGTSYTNSKLKTGTKYYYKFTAVNGDYESGYSNVVSLYAAAKSVTKLKAKSNEYNKITLTWKKASGATKYVIYRSTSQTSGFKKIKTVTTTNYTNKVKTGATYYYKVVSYSNKAKGGESTVVSATAICAAPTNVKATCKSNTSAKITWKKTSGAGLYAIYRSNSKNSGYTLLCNISKNKSSYTDKTVSAGTKYYYKICAVTRNVEGKKSKVVSVNIKPAAVKNLTAKTAGGKNVTLTWSASTGATIYYIYRSTSSSKGYKKIGQTTELSYSNTKLTNGKTYYYRVYARAGNINSSYTQVSYVNPSKVYVSSSALTLKPGKTSNLTVTFKPSKVSDTSITWSSADTTIATVSSNGVVIALASGVTTITATSCNGVKATCEVSINKETPAPTQAPTPATNIVVVLDPGHGGYDPGAVYGSLREKDLALKTAQYTKAELEKYNGIIVKMTRTTDTYIGLEQRTIIAKDYGADLFVSLHYNAGASSANGAEVLVSSNGNYNSSSTKLGSQILSNINGLGLRNRGVKTRLSSSGVSDYYSVIRNSVKRGFSGIIVEGAFVSSAGDRTIISTEAGLKSIGVATATGIAKYYGLSKK